MHQPVTFGALQLHIRSLVYSTATIVVRNVYASPPARTGTRRNVHAKAIGKLRKADPSAHDEPNKT